MIRRLERHAPHIEYHLKDGRKVSGASTIAGVGKPCNPLMAWAAKLAREGKDWKNERDQSADVGSIAHFMVDCHLWGDEPDLTEFTQEEIDTANFAFEKFISFWDKAGIKPIVSEQPLVSETYRYGGTLDLIGEKVDTKELILFDWKTARAVYESMLYQVGGGYYQLWNENNPDRPVKRVAIVRIGRTKKGDFQTYWIPATSLPKYWKVFHAQLQLHQAMKEVTYK